MKQNEPSSAEPQIYTILESGKRKARFLMLFGAVYPLLVGWALWHGYQFWGFSPRVILFMAWIFIFTGFFAFVLLSTLKAIKRKFEVSSEGITILEGNGERRVLRWDELGKLREETSGTHLTLVDKAGKKQLHLSAGLVDGFDRLKKRINAEFDQRQQRPLGSAGVDVYSMPSSVAKTFRWGGIFFLLFAVAVVPGLIIYHNEPHPQIAHPLVLQLLCGFCGFFLLGLAIYLLVWGAKISKSKIEVTDHGIARLEGDGSKVFIRWEDVGRLTKRERMKQIGVYDVFGGKKIMVDYQFELFSRIKDRILGEFEKRFKLPAMPVTYGRLPVFPNPRSFIFFFSILGGLVWAWVGNSNHQRGSIGFLFTAILGMYFFALREESALVKAFIVDREKLSLYRAFGKVVLPWENLASVEYEPKATQHGSYYLLRVKTTEGKEYPFTTSLSSQVETYMVLKKMIEAKTTLS